jgi:hypothetical protein
MLVGRKSLLKRKLIPGKDRPLDLPKVGRPTKSEAQERNVEAILDRVSNGEDLGTVCGSLGMSPSTFRGWCRSSQVLDQAWQLARREYAHSLFDRIAELAAKLASNAMEMSAAEVNAMKAAIDGYKHVAARLNPAQYGEQKAGQQGVAVFINTTLPIGPGEQPAEEIEKDFTVVAGLLEKK